MGFFTLEYFRSKSTLSNNGFILLVTICIIASLSFVTGIAYGSTCNNNICVSFDSGLHLADHGALITVTDPSLDTQSPIPLSVIVQVSEPTNPAGAPGNSIPVTLTAVSQNNPTTFTGYVYFQNNDNPTPMLQPSLTISNTGGTGYNVTITATYNGLQDSTTISTANFDNVKIGGQVWPNWPTPTPQSVVSGTVKVTCSNMGADGICPSWKTSSGLKIPWPGKNNPPHYYFYKCDPQNPPFPGTLVGDSNTDPQCPSTSQTDVYVEVDYLTGHKPDVSLLNKVINTFSTNGITLHIQLDEEIKLHSHAIQSPSPGSSGDTQFDLIKKYFFGNSTSRGITSASFPYYNPELTAKKQVFHYALFMHAQADANGNADTISGYSELPGNDMSISLGTFTGGVGSADELAGTFMHELGHNLYLDHGGADSYNCKPNYNSVMNYEYQDTSIVPDRLLDYSHGAFSNFPLNPGSLNENTGFSTNTILRSFPNIGYGYLGSDGQNHVQIVPSTSPIVEWDNPDTVGATNVDNGNENSASSQIDDMHSQRITSQCGGSTGVTLQDYNDWTSLKYNFKSYSSFVDTIRIPVGDPTNNLFVNTDSNSTWLKNYFNSSYVNGTVQLKRHHANGTPYITVMLPYKIPNEMTLKDVIQHHSKVIMSAAHIVNMTNMDKFNNNSAKYKITQYLLMANSTVYDYAKTIGNLKVAEKLVHSSINDKYIQNQVLSLVEPAIKTNELANTANSTQGLNIPPSLESNAGYDQNVTGEQIVNLDGSLSTGSGPLSFQWQQISGEPVVLSSTTAAQLHFITPLLGNSKMKTLEFELTVNDAHGGSSTSIVRIFVIH